MTGLSSDQYPICYFCGRELLCLERITLANTRYYVTLCTNKACDPDEHAAYYFNLPDSTTCPEKSTTSSDSPAKSASTSTSTDSSNTK